ncbi:UDP-galactose transporter [Cladophialophora carrionii]|uniref:UDP-galactose transporter homolog 1 n=1 Tax=Cladophialophora carrionii TaxID=86049 RepID=A0A1C1CU33_9EURO|nr:UDP-galactose transporter [Cladophialophora carrionii]
MARRKQITPMQRINSGEVMQTPSDTPERRAVYSNGHLASPAPTRPLRPPTQARAQQEPSAQQPGLLTLLVCVGGIYASFLTWSVLQERITTTPYPLTTTTTVAAAQAAQAQHEYFRFPIVLNTIQSSFAFTSGSLYLLYKTGATSSTSFQILPSPAALLPLLLVTVTTTLASPFGYASLAHVDYLTFVLAKSCKLLPVMALHVTLFRKRYPLSKYMIVLAVTAGVALFTLYHPPKKSAGKAEAKAAQSASSLYGLLLLAINLLFDGLTNTVQDHIFQSPARYGRTTGPQMMVVLNLLGTALMAAYLVLTPYVPPALLPRFLQTDAATELSQAVAFLRRHPPVLKDVLAFCACGAVGQLFIYATLERFSSLLLVTVTVTRKMLTMVLSVLWFGHRLGRGQWLGVGLVFGGIAAEAYVQNAEKKAKERMKSVEKDR